MEPTALGEGEGNSGAPGRWAGPAHLGKSVHNPEPTIASQPDLLSPTRHDSAKELFAS